MDFSYDQYGCVVQKDGDGGDSLARTGLLGFLAPNEYPGVRVALLKLKVAPGVYIRNCNAPYNNWRDTSRDQYIAPLCYFSLTQRTLNVFAIEDFLLDNNDEFPNGDIAGPDVWSIIFRGQNKHKLWIWLYDLWLIPSVLLRCWQARDPNDVGDDINLSTILIHNSMVMPTLPVRIARWLYAKLRPRGVQYAWDWYFRPETHANPFNELARPYIKEFLS